MIYLITSKYFWAISSVGQSTCLTSRGSQVRVLYRPPCAGIAQLVEQLTCNQQVVGSSPISGTTLYLEGQRSGQTRQTVNLFLRVRWFKSISFHHLFGQIYKLYIASQPSGKAPHFDCGMRQFESSRGSHYVPLAQLVEHLTFNQRVTDSNSVRDTILKFRNSL